MGFAVHCIHEQQTWFPLVVFIGCLGPTMKGRHFCDGFVMASGVTSSEGWLGKIHLDSCTLWGWG